MIRGVGGGRSGRVAGAEVVMGEIGAHAAFVRVEGSRLEKDVLWAEGVFCGGGRGGGGGEIEAHTTGAACFSVTISATRSITTTTTINITTATAIATATRAATV